MGQSASYQLDNSKVMAGGGEEAENLPHLKNEKALLLKNSGKPDIY